MSRRKPTELPTEHLAPPRTRLIWFAGLALGIAAGALVALELASLASR